MHGRIAIKLEKDIFGEIRRSGNDGFENFLILYSLGTHIMEEYEVSKRSKQESYDEATEYFHEALAIAETIQSQESILLSSQIYLRLSVCELVKPGERNIGKALDYKAKGLLKFGKLDQTFKMENSDGIKLVLDDIKAHPI